MRPDGPAGPRPSKKARGVTPPADAPEPRAIVALVDELAILAADLWSSGRLDSFVAPEKFDAEDDE
jgi:hypothetical protein